MGNKISIINIGDELLIGQVVNTNAAQMGKMLTQTGFQVVDSSCVSDSREGILFGLEKALQHADIVLISGGLGPTKDDITKKVLCEYFNTSLQHYAPALENVERLFRARGLPIHDSNRAQAMLPAACEPLPNSQGTAFGMWFTLPKGQVVISMPGVPYEMMGIMEAEVLPRLCQQFQPIPYFQHTLMTQGLGESVIAKRIAPIEAAMPSQLHLAYLPRPGLVRLRLSAWGSSIGEAQELVMQTAQAIENILGEAVVYGYNDISIEEVIAERLITKGASLATAESCTGGAIATRLTANAGASQYFLGSVVSYSNTAKIELLDVPEDILKTEGAVSKATVEAMLKGVQSRFHSDYAIAVSGIAGPSGGSKDKAVGTVFIGVLSPNNIRVERFLFGKHRGRNIERSTLTALNMLRQSLL